MIAKETGLRVVGIEGENKTTKMLNGLHNDSYDVLVCTAGMFWALYENDRIFFKMFRYSKFFLKDTFSSKFFYFKLCVIARTKKLIS